MWPTVVLVLPSPSAQLWRGGGSEQQTQSWAPSVTFTSIDNQSNVAVSKSSQSYSKPYIPRCHPSAFSCIFCCSKKFRCVVGSMLFDHNVNTAPPKFRDPFLEIKIHHQNHRFQNMLLRGLPSGASTNLWVSIPSSCRIVSTSPYLKNGLISKCVRIAVSCWLFQITFSNDVSFRRIIICHSYLSKQDSHC